MTAPSQKVKITNPERVARILQRVAAGGLPVQVRSLGQSETSVKGRAIASGSIDKLNGFSIGGISEKGRIHLGSYSDSGVQIEFVLMSVKIVFVAKMLAISGNSLLVSIPDCLTSIERRQDARFPMTLGTRAYMKIDDWHPEAKDPVVIPFFEYQREYAPLIHLGDVSMGGISVVSRFPALCRVLHKGSVVERVSVLFPLTEPIPAEIEVRWVKRLKESVEDFQGSPRTFRIYKFGVKFVNPSEKLQLEIQRFISKLAMAEAI